MPLRCTGMQKILNGHLRYRSKLRMQLLKEFELVGDHPDPQSILITCIDSRILSSRIIQASPGDVFISRNPGNLVPNYKNLSKDTPRSEEAALELACVYNHVNTIAVCGHSDCKAMNLVYDNRKQEPKSNDSKDGVLKKWLMLNSQETIKRFTELEKYDFKKPVKINISKEISFDAFIDPSNDFAFNDKFSQLNTLCQLENLQKFYFLNDLIAKKRLSVYAMWLDIYNGDVYIFSYKDKSFVKLNEDNHASISESINY